MMEKGKLIEEILKDRGLISRGSKDVLDIIHEFLAEIPEDKRKDRNFVLSIIESLDDYVSIELTNLDWQDEDDKKMMKEYDLVVADVLENLISEDLSKDEDFFLDILSTSQDNSCYYNSNMRYPLLQYANSNLTNNKEFMLKAIKEDGFLINYASEELKNDTDLILGALEETRNGEILKDVSEELRGNKEFMIKAVEQSFEGLKFASKELQNDKEVVLKAVQHAPSEFVYASENLKNDKEFMLELLQCSNISGLALEYASEELKRDKDVVLTAVKTNGGALEYASEELQNDKEVVLVGVRQSADQQRAYCLDYASERLRGDKEVVLEAAKYSVSALMYANEELKNDRECMLEAIKSNEEALKYVSDELRNDKNFVSMAVTQNPNISDSSVGWKLQKDWLFMYNLDTMRKESSFPKKQDKNHDISEVVETITDRKPENINKVVSEISEEVQNEIKDNEQTKE